MAAKNGVPNANREDKRLFICLRRSWRLWQAMTATRKQAPAWLKLDGLRLLRRPDRLAKPVRCHDRPSLARRPRLPSHSTDSPLRHSRDTRIRRSQINTNHGAIVVLGLLLLLGLGAERAQAEDGDEHERDECQRAEPGGPLWAAGGPRGGAASHGVSEW